MTVFEFVESFPNEIDHYQVYVDGDDHGSMVEDLVDTIDVDHERQRVFIRSRPPTTPI